MSAHLIVPFNRKDIIVYAGDTVGTYMDPVTGETAARVGEIAVDALEKTGTVIALDYTTRDGERHEGVAEYDPAASRIKKDGKLYIIFMES
jgi:hypothetical protein